MPKVFSLSEPDFNIPTFNVGERVLLVALERNGTVRMIRFDGSEWLYYVSWWDEGQRREAWLEADELSK